MELAMGSCILLVINVFIDHFLLSSFLGWILNLCGCNLLSVWDLLLREGWWWSEDSGPNLIGVCSLGDGLGTLVIGQALSWVDLISICMGIRVLDYLS